MFDPWLSERNKYIVYRLIELEWGCPNGTKYPPRQPIPNRAILPNRTRVYRRTDRRTDRVIPVYPPPNFVAGVNNEIAIMSTFIHYCPQRMKKTESLTLHSFTQPNSSNETNTLFGENFACFSFALFTLWSMYKFKIEQKELWVYANFKIYKI